MKIIVTGSIAFDYLMSFPGRFTDHILADQLHQISLSFLVDSMKRQRGGTAPNIAYTLGLLGADPGVLASAGQDFGGYRTWLEEHGVDTTGIVEVPDDYCASFFVNTDLEQNQIASFYTGAMSHARYLTFADYTPDADLAIISPNDPTAMRNHVLECKQRGIPYIYDPSQQTIRLTAEDLEEGVSGCYLLTVNGYELGMITEKTGLSEEDIRRRAGGLLVTKGMEGSRLYVDGQVIDIPIVSPRRVAEPTGAGDAYRAGLMRGIQLGLPWDVAGRMGALCATYVLEEVGTQNHYFTPESFISRYREHFDDDGMLECLRRP